MINVTLNLSQAQCVKNEIVILLLLLVILILIVILILTNRLINKYDYY